MNFLSRHSREGGNRSFCCFVVATAKARSDSRLRGNDDLENYAPNQLTTPRPATTPLAKHAVSK
jgi:hypothetical protein